MVASLLTTLMSLPFGLASLLYILVGLFQLWMCIDAIRKGEWFWAVIIFFGFGLSAIFYFFLVYRGGGGDSSRGFELPGSFDRRRVKQLQAQIHHLDNAHHHYQLGDLYFRKGKMEKAELSYRAALERDPADLDNRAHLGQCLLRQKRPKDALPWLTAVVQENPKHEFGYTLMALAECQTALGDVETAIQTWQRVTANNSYPRAKVQLAELWIAKGQNGQARDELRDVISDDAHAPTFQRRRDTFWVRRARKLLSKLPAPAGGK